MPVLYNIPDELRQMWQSVRDALKSADVASEWPLQDIAGPGLLSSMMPESLQEAYIGGLLNMTPGYLAANYRSPEAIQALRKMMAEEMRSRGPVAYNKQVSSVPRALSNDELDVMYGSWQDYIKRFGEDTANVQYSKLKPDPIEQILRGSWYHGMSDEARSKMNPSGFAYQDIFPIEKNMPTGNLTWEPGLGFIPKSEYMLPKAEMYLDQLSDKLRRETGSLVRVNKYGFPISHHDAASISNKLGEPSGISLSMLPTKAQQFSADEFLHRVLPMYGGSPRERVVNLMTPEGRAALNDAYDIVANKSLFTKNKVLGSEFSPADTVIDFTNRSSKWLKPDIERFFSQVYDSSYPDIGGFNQALSSQLQSSGYRGLLYNPQRWNEYEMLMLDPKYVLPLDYRKVGEYVKHPVTLPISGMEKVIPESTATPGTRKGLSQIQDLMQQNASRLGDIYAERPWTQRLSQENKQQLLELIDPNYREIVGKQLYE